MATRKKSGGSGAGFGTFLVGFLCALLLAAGGGWGYLHWGKNAKERSPLPAARGPAETHAPAGEEQSATPSGPAATPPFAPPATGARAAHLVHASPEPPFDVSEDVFEAGAHVYRQQCASCHGVPGHDAAAGQRTQPPAAQLWKRVATGSATGVSHHTAGETFLQIKEGVPRSAMPSYGHVLSDNQIWDLSLLLRNAGEQLPDPVVAILQRP